MQIVEILSDLGIAITNEESSVLGKMQGVRLLSEYSERDQVIITNLIRKSLVRKIDDIQSNKVLVTKNEFKTD
jgi:hypothetical protein